jgi:hypothetical protein
MKQSLLLATLLVSTVCQAQTVDPLYVYRRGSIYSIMISHRGQLYENDIEAAFSKMPIPEKYNDHGLGKKVFYTSEKKINIKNLDKHEGFKVNDASDQSKMNEYDFFLQRQNIASRLVAKWFHRNKSTGVCDMELVKDRGYANASETDKRLAALSARKEAVLMDAGEELIGSTFVLVNDIRYIDKSKGSLIIGGVVSAAIKTNDVLHGKNTLEEKDLGDVIASYKGFNVKIKTYLYQLVWDEQVSSSFYSDIYTEQPDDSKKENFENKRGDFSLVYLGMQESSGTDVSFIGINENEPQVMVLKACQRALDENVANLQKNFEVFKIKTPLISAEPLKCEIGLKEGVTEKSRYEVLEAVLNEKGHIEYKRRGIIRAVKGKIWDNRFMATEEKAENASLGFTTFEKVSGGDFYQGMLVRELK